MDYVTTGLVQHGGFLDCASKEDVNILTRLIIETDPINGRRHGILFSDDGSGNGLPIFHFFFVNADPQED